MNGETKSRAIAFLLKSSMKKGAVPQLENLHVISFQFFDAFKDSPNYRHTVQLRNQEQIVYFERQTVTLVEVGKFLRQADKFASDNCRIALWLRAIDALNREDDFSRYEGAQDKAREMAAAMLAEGEPVDKIAKYTGLSESEILEIKATLDQK